MYDKNDMEHCPVCGKPRSLIGRDFNTTSHCSLGHTWHWCLKHKCVALGKPCKVNSIGDCTCPNEVEISEKIPDPFITPEFPLDIVKISSEIAGIFAEQICSVQPMTKSCEEYFQLKYEDSDEMKEKIKRAWFEDNPREKFPEFKYEEISLSVFDMLTGGQDINRIIQVNLKPEDKICTYRSADWTWGALCGRAGVCVVRDGMVVAFDCIWMS